MIIAHNNDYEVFKKILELSVCSLQNQAKSNAKYFLTRGGVNLEKDVYNTILTHSQNTTFQNNIELVSGQKFPDIVAYVNKSKAYGLEVKTTKNNKWKSTGSSIFEGTRVENIEKIHLLFGKLSAPVEFKCRRYEDCLYDVAITHSPRYLIDMETEEHCSIFSKIGVEYDELRKLSNPFEPIKDFFRSNLKKGDDLWWIDSNEDNVSDLNIKLWTNLSSEEKDHLRIVALAYFPNLLGNDNKKYSYLATWLVARFSVVNHALRDTFSAGGKIIKDGLEFPRIFDYIFLYIDEILNEVVKIQYDDRKYYWAIDNKNTNQENIHLWKKLCLQHCKPVLKKEQFTFVEKFLSKNS